MNLRNKLLVAMIITGLMIFSIVQAQERKIKREQLPPAVEKTVTAESQGAQIRGFSTEVEKGKRLYEAELTINGHSKDISMDEQGNVVEVEEEVSLDSLPAEVKAGLTKAAGAGMISKVESLTKKGKLIAYEAVVRMGAKRREIQVGPDGKRLAHPE
ncbi:MAG: hypothetical protein DMF68_04100 [Acidobacteria bacterium]|nr:MAG: hypothetical protein DMF68_04100 [Acidobacteriota bacterium]